MKHKKFRRVLALTLMILTLLPSFAFATNPGEDPGGGSEVTPSAPVNQGGDSGTDEDYSFYKIASAASSFFSDMLAPGSDTEGKDGSAFADMFDANGNGGVDGALLGYRDGEKTKGGITGWLDSAISAASNTIYYEALRQDPKGQGKTESSTGLSAYALYGAMLDDLGIDKSSEKNPFNPGRTVGGYATLALYTLVTVLDSLFKAALNIMQMFNPFRLFQGAMEGVQSKYEMGKAIGSDSPLANLAAIISDVLKGFSKLSWAVSIPIFFVMLVGSLLLFSSGNGGSKVKRYVIRIFFLVLGLPLLGSLYTGALNQLTAPDSQSMGATQAVMSTFVDFRSWASDHGMLLPSGAKVGYVTGLHWRATPEAKRNARRLAYDINAMTYPNIANGLSVSGSNTSQWNTLALQETNKSAASQDEIESVRSILLAYKNAERYTGSDFETEYKAILSKQYSGDKDDLKDMIKDSGDPKKIKKIKPENIFFSTQGGSLTHPGKGFRTSGEPHSGSNYKKARPLSPIAMYNYLNTQFSSKSLEVYSSVKSVGNFTKPAHYAVNVVGGGIMGTLNLVNLLALLGCYVVLGLAYALGMIIDNIKRSIKMIGAVPFAMLGSLRSITLVIVHGLILSVEIFMSIFIYLVAQQILLAISGAIIDPIESAIPTSTAMQAALMAKGAGSSSSSFSYYLPMVMTIISIVVTIWFTIAAIRLRPAILKGIDEGVSNVVSKFTMGSAGGGTGMYDDKHKPNSPFRSGLQAGAAGALMNKLGGNKDDEKKDETADGVTEGDVKGPKDIEKVNENDRAETAANMMTNGLRDGDEFDEKDQDQDADVDSPDSDESASDENVSKAEEMNNRFKEGAFKGEGKRPMSMKEAKNVAQEMKQNAGLYLRGWNGKELKDLAPQKGVSPKDQVEAHKNREMYKDFSNALEKNPNSMKPSTKSNKDGSTTSVGVHKDKKGNVVSVTDKQSDKGREVTTMSLAKDGSRTVSTKKYDKNGDLKEDSFKSYDAGGKQTSSVTSHPSDEGNPMARKEQTQRGVQKMEDAQAAYSLAKATGNKEGMARAKTSYENAAKQAGRPAKLSDTKGLSAAKDEREQVISSLYGQETLDSYKKQTSAAGREKVLRQAMTDNGHKTTKDVVGAYNQKAMQNNAPVINSDRVIAESGGKTASADVLMSNMAADSLASPYKQRNVMGGSRVERQDSGKVLYTPNKNVNTARSSNRSSSSGTVVDGHVQTESGLYVPKNSGSTPRYRQSVDMGDSKASNSRNSSSKSFSNLKGATGSSQYSPQPRTHIKPRSNSIYTPPTNKSVVQNINRSNNIRQNVRRDQSKPKE